MARFDVRHASWRTWCPLRPLVSVCAACPFDTWLTSFSAPFSSEPSDFILVARLAHMGSGALPQVCHVGFLPDGSLGEGPASGVTTGAPPAGLAHMAHMGWRGRRNHRRATRGPGAHGAHGLAAARNGWRGRRNHRRATCGPGAHGAHGMARPA
jgi:hypothetical protein